MIPRTLDIQVPRALKPLLAPARYKGAYGGRGGAKSHFFAEQMVKRAYKQPIRAVCIREVQNSLRESVRQLIVDKIAKFGLEDQFEVLDAEIRGKCGSLIIFKGMQHYNAETVKSLEGFDIAWVEEAQSFSGTSLRTLRPTLRNPDSELWFSWNPRTKRDAVDAFLRVEKPPNSIVVPVSWRDNPWFPDVLRQEMEHDYLADPLTAAHVWGGDYQIMTKGSYYGALLAQLDQLGRLKPIPWEPQLVVHTGWDLGVGDSTVVWFAQIVHGEPRLIDCYAAAGVGLDHYVAQLRAEHRSHWIYGQHFFPHDVAVRELGSGMSRVDILRGFGLNPTVLPLSSVDDGISQVRFMLRKMWINSDRCGDGVDALRQYRSEWDEKREVQKLVPLHDWTSDFADSLRYLCIGLGRHFLDRQPLPDTMLSHAAREQQRRVNQNMRGGGKGRPYGW